MIGQRAASAALVFATAALVWAALFFRAQVAPAAAAQLAPKLHPLFDHYVAVTPLWLLVAFGAYSLGNIGWSLATFGDCDAAHAELQREIAQAKRELRGKGVAVDA